MYRLLVADLRLVLDSTFRTHPFLLSRRVNPSSVFVFRDDTTKRTSQPVDTPSFVRATVGQAVAAAGLGLLPDKRHARHGPAS
jgi:hypothetical protein